MISCVRFTSTNLSLNVHKMMTFSLIVCALVLYNKGRSVCVRFMNLVFWEDVSSYRDRDQGAGRVIVWDV